MWRTAFGEKTAALFFFCSSTLQSHVGHGAGFFLYCIGWSGEPNDLGRADGQRLVNSVKELVRRGSPRVADEDDTGGCT